MRRFVCVLLVVFIVALGAPHADAASGYEAPVDGPVIDPFRPPPNPYGPGNRGIDYAVEPGALVRASNDGVVVFAGHVGLTLHVVVLHEEGIRTSYSFLSAIDVKRGDRVGRGEVVGRAGDELHFGARVGDEYIDPAKLLGGAPPLVHLIPALRGPGTEEEERKGLLRSLASGLGRTVHAGAAAVEWARDRVGDAAVTVKLLDEYAHPERFLLDLWATAQALRRDQRGCTAPSTTPAAPTGGRHVAILVGGFGSEGGKAAVLDVDTRALGYADSDVAQFSYRGGQAPGTRQLEGVPVNDYDGRDSEGDIRDAAQRFRELLETVRVTNPGVPVDVIAHSQGGLVVRAALGDDLDHLDPRLPAVDRVITLGTPHHGADLADINASLGTHVVGQLVQAGVREATNGHTDPWSEAAGQLPTISSFTQELAGRPQPAGARITAIAASGDLVVPVPRAVLDAADNVVVPLTGLHAHDQLPGSPEAEREIRLALAGQRPTCTGAGDAALGSVIAGVERQLGGLLTAGSVLAGSGR